MMARQEQDAMMLPAMELPNNKTDYTWEQVATVTQNKRAVDEGDSEAQDYTGDESIAQVLPGKRQKTVRSRATSSRADYHNGNAHLEASSASFGQFPPAGTSAKAFNSQTEPISQQCSQHRLKPGLEAPKTWKDTTAYDRSPFEKASQPLPEGRLGFLDHDDTSQQYEAPTNQLNPPPSPAPQAYHLTSPGQYPGLPLPANSVSPRDLDYSKICRDIHRVVCNSHAHQELFFEDRPERSLKWTERNIDGFQHLAGKRPVHHLSQWIFNAGDIAFVIFKE
ncbi:hypothetical protein ACEPPN_015427 [Leptodophora sp. 'Broadleaf-Isolate-01']